MRTINVVNMEKFQKGYLTRKNFWAKIDFGMLWDSGFSSLCEIDRWRFIAFIIIQAKTKQPIDADPEYLTKFGMNFGAKGRRLQSTIRQLSRVELIEIGHTSDGDQTEIGHTSDGDQAEIKETEDLLDKNLQGSLYKEKKRVKKKRIDKSKYVKDNIPSLQEVLTYIKEQKLNVNGQFFYKKCMAENWHNSRGKPMASWKGTLVTWDNNAQEVTEKSEERKFVL